MVLEYLLLTSLALVGLFMIFIILLQRGRGGGLAGAFGGLGGQSAFGTRAGDVFTKITIGIACVWVLLAGISVLVLQRDANTRYSGGREATEITAPDDETTDDLDAQTPPAEEDPFLVEQTPADNDSDVDTSVDIQAEADPDSESPVENPPADSSTTGGDN